VRSIFALVLLTLATSSSQAQAPSAATAADLKPTVLKFLFAIRDGKPLELLAFWSADGVAFGIDGDSVSKVAFRKDVDRKGYLYCFFFDTDCLRKRDDEMRQKGKAQPRGNPLCSYKDLLVGFSTDTVKAFPHREAGILVGDVLVQLEKAKNPQGNTQTELRFTFVLEHDAWRLTAVQYE
jgi:hypothetical protein